MDDEAPYDSALTSRVVFNDMRNDKELLIAHIWINWTSL